MAGLLAWTKGIGQSLLVLIGHSVAMEIGSALLGGNLFVAMLLLTPVYGVALYRAAHSWQSRTPGCWALAGLGFGPLAAIAAIITAIRHQRQVARERVLARAAAPARIVERCSGCGGPIWDAREVCGACATARRSGVAA
jgi:hypothetical protein